MNTNKATMFIFSVLDQKKPKGRAGKKQLGKKIEPIFWRPSKKNSTYLKKS